MLWLASEALLVFASWVFATRIAPNVSALERALATTTLHAPLATLLVSLASCAHAIAALPIFSMALALATIALGMMGHDERAIMREDLRRARGTLRQLTAPMPLLLCTGPILALCAAGLAAGLCEPWAWDALGYHLPFLFDAISEEHFRHVPTHIPYVNAYPDFIDRFAVFQSALSSTWTWVDAFQFTFVPQGILAGAVMLRRSGLPTRMTLAWSALWLSIPIVMLELPTNYVDVAVTCTAATAVAWSTGTLSRATLFLSAVAITYLLGSKPSAPPTVVLLVCIVLVRAQRARKLKLACASLALLVLGTPKYLINLAHYGNPVWPVALHLGPIVFPGPTTPTELALMGVREPWRSMSAPMRTLYSWFSWVPEHWIYDMRVGGFGPLFLLCVLTGLPVAVLAMRSRWLQKRIWATVYAALVLLITSLLSPGSYWTRYSMAAPFALLLVAGCIFPALLVPETSFLVVSARAKKRWWIAATIFSAMSLYGVYLSSGGLTGGGPSVLELVSMPASERRNRVAVDGMEGNFAEARASIRAGHAFAYDASFGLPGRLAHPERNRRIVYFDASLTRDELGVPHAEHYRYETLLRFVREQNVDAIVLGSAPQLGTAYARAHPEVFHELFACADEPCAVFAVRSASAH